MRKNQDGKAGEISDVRSAWENNCFIEEHGIRVHKEFLIAVTAVYVCILCYTLVKKLDYFSFTHVYLLCTI